MLRFSIRHSTTMQRYINAKRIIEQTLLNAHSRFLWFRHGLLFCCSIHLFQLKIGQIQFFWCNFEHDADNEWKQFRQINQNPQINFYIIKIRIRLIRINQNWVCIQLTYSFNCELISKMAKSILFSPQLFTELLLKIIEIWNILNVDSTH